MAVRGGYVRERLSGLSTANGFCDLSDDAGDEAHDDDQDPALDPRVNHLEHIGKGRNVNGADEEPTAQSKCSPDEGVPRDVVAEKP